MKLTRIGTDFVKINEENIEKFKNIKRIHIIGLNFNNPTEEKIKKVLSLYSLTRRFIIEDNVRIYNNVLKKTNRKYYVMNNMDDKLISFFRKNNKVLINFFRMNNENKNFLLDDNNFQDMLKNTEVIIINKKIFNCKRRDLEEWNGNVIIDDKELLS